MWTYCSYRTEVMGEVGEVWWTNTQISVFIDHIV